MIAAAVIAASCAHIGATTADSNTSRVDTAPAAAQGDASDQASKEQDRQKILAMKDLTLADLYKPKPETKEVV